MDAAYFRLTRNPFERNPGLDEACLPPPFADLVRELVAGLQFPRTITIVVGQSGVGKTTLASVLAATLGRDAAVAQVTAARPDLDAVLREVLQQLEPRLARGGGFAPTLEALARSTASRHEDRIPTVVVVDDAHQLASDSIGNLCRSSHAHVVLFGRPMLLESLKRALPGAALEASIDQVRVRSMLPMTREHALNYLEDRVTSVGGRVDALFTPAALGRIVEATGGLATRLEALTAAALGAAQEAGQREVGVETVERVLAQAVPEAPDGSTIPSPAEGSLAGAGGWGDRPAPAEPGPVARIFPAPASGRAGGATARAAGAAPPGGERPRASKPSGAGKRRAARVSHNSWWVGTAAAILVGAAWLGFSAWTGREGKAAAGSTPTLVVPQKDLAGAESPGSDPTAGTGADRGGWGFAKTDPVAEPLPDERNARDVQDAVPSRGDWIVQVGAFRSRRNAEDVVASLLSVDPSAEIRVRGQLNYVVTRSFPSQAEATAFATRVQETGLPAFVRRWVPGS